MLLFIHLTIVSLLSLRILSRDNMHSTSRLTWMLVLTFLPFLGAIVYLLFGEINLGHITNARAKAVYELIHLKKKQLYISKSARENVNPIYVPAFEFATSINGFNTTIGNKAELMENGDVARSRLIEDVENSSHSVNVLYYIWLDDKTGTDLANALIRAAERGVVCRVMIDGLGSRNFIKSKIWAEMKKAGVRTSIASPLNHLIKTIFTSRLDLRNHRKITVIDNKITYCGSQNCADEAFLIKAKYAPWVDILLRFEGPVVAQNLLLFASDWLLKEEDNIESFIITYDNIDDGFVAQVWGDGPTVRAAATPQMFCTLINQARESLTISTPYFVPDEIVLSALCAAAYRGVKVTIIFPANNDSWIVGAASRSHYGEMLDAGIVIYEYEKGLLHAKTLTIDGLISLIGSTNLDLRSFELNYENNILLQDASITKAIYKRQMDYISSSHLVNPEDVAKWSLSKRILYNIIATLGPVL